MINGIVAISEAVSLGLHGMCLLATLERRLSANEMAGILGGSEAHLTKVFQRLTRVGLVRSFRGVGGGFELALPPREISLLSIYNAIEGPARGTLCSCCAQCPFKTCIFGSELDEFERHVLSYLSRTTLDEISLKPGLKQRLPDSSART